MNNITVRELLNILIKNIIIIIISAVICASGAYIYCEKFTDERFQAQGDILVTNGGINTNEGENPESENPDTTTESGDSAVANTDVAASINLLPTIRSILSGVPIYKEFAEYLSENSNYNYNYKVLKSAATVGESDTRSLIVTVYFELGSVKEAIDITNHFLRFAPTYIESKIKGSRIDAEPVCDSAVKTAPRTLRTSFLAAILGMAIAYTIAFLITIFNSTIQSDEDFSTRYNIPVIGNIPDFSISHNNSKPHSKKNSGGKNNG
ncbi:MAG: hypothetical protein IJA44_05445 [Clostridia bacterium]|nr:hypothetical protein [Clostridia bacterium]